MKALLVGGIVLGEIQVSNLKKTSAKTLYTGFTSSFPPPKVEEKFDIDWSQVWRRLQSPSWNPDPGRSSSCSSTTLLQIETD